MWTEACRDDSPELASGEQRREAFETGVVTDQHQSRAVAVVGDPSSRAEGVAS